MIIKANNKIYVLKGSSDDIGQHNNYYTTKDIIRTYNIIYDNIPGIVTAYYTIYLDANTK